ncbi:MAG: hypothetical protein ISQ13_04105 [Candidatus Margulisbacteria bacterium]|nr:hypothetical protein [Candidatus Margulisiibacteriota bacterium]
MIPAMDFLCCSSGRNHSKEPDRRRGIQRFVDGPQKQTSYNVNGEQQSTVGGYSCPLPHPHTTQTLENLVWLRANDDGVYEYTALLAHITSCRLNNRKVFSPLKNDVTLTMVRSAYRTNSWSFEKRHNVDCCVKTINQQLQTAPEECGK